MDFFTDRQTFLITIVGVAVALWIIVSVIMKIWPFLSNLVTMVNGFVGYKDEPGVLDRIKALEENSENERANHDKMSQQFDRVEAKLEMLSSRLDESVADRQRLWEIARKYHDQGELEP